MIFIDKETKQDPVKRWNLPNRIFFAAGACHILAYEFLMTYPEHNFQAYWIKPGAGMSGNHIFVSDGRLAFDYDGLKLLPEFLAAVEESMKSHYENWTYELVMLPQEVLVSGPLSRQYEGLWLREPGQFLKDPLPRAKVYMNSIITEDKIRDCQDSNKLPL